MQRHHLDAVVARVELPGLLAQLVLQRSLSTVPIGTLAPKHPAIAQHRASIAAICQRYGIRRLEVFGSAARGDDFLAETSDADFLVEFAADARPDLRSFYGAKAELEQLQRQQWVEPCPHFVRLG